VAARQNGFPVAFGAALVILRLLWRPMWPRRWRGAALRTVVAALVVALVMGSQMLYVRLLLNVKAAHPEQAVELYDLVGISKRINRNLLDPRIFPAGDLGLLRSRSTTDSFDDLLFGQPILIRYPVADELIDDLRAAWLRAIADHPSAYVGLRIELFLNTLGITSDPQWVQHPWVDKNPWGFHPSVPILEQRFVSFITWFADLPGTDGNPGLIGGVFYRVWLYLLVDIIAVAYLFHRDPRRVVLGALSLTVVLYQFTFLLGAMGNQYRFCVPVVAVALLMAPIGFDDLRAYHRSRRTAPTRPRSRDQEALSRRSW
jgi:hypothetical protein